MEQYSSLKNVTTPKILIEMVDKKPLFNGKDKHIDADDELKAIAEFIKLNSPHNDSIEPERIKYFYTTMSKKDGGRFTVGTLTPRVDVERLINQEYDFILTVFYKAWSKLDIQNKVIQLDKILCGVNAMQEDVKKKPADSKEYLDNLKHFGPKEVLESSEMIDMSITSILEEEKEERKNKKNTPTANDDNDENEQGGDE